MRSPARLVSLSILVAGLLVAGCGGGNSGSSTQQESGPPPLPDGELAIENPWVRPAPAGSSSVLYMTIANGRSGADTLLDADAPIIGGVQMYDLPADTAAPTPDSLLIVPPQSRLALEPNGRYVALSGLGQSLNENESLILNLDFAQSGLQRVRVPIRTSPPSGQ